MNFSSRFNLFCFVLALSFLGGGRSSSAVNSFYEYDGNYALNYPSESELDYAIELINRAKKNIERSQSVGTFKKNLEAAQEALKPMKTLREFDTYLGTILSKGRDIRRATKFEVNSDTCWQGEIQDAAYLLQRDDISAKINGSRYTDVIQKRNKISVVWYDDSGLSPGVEVEILECE